MKTRLMKNKTIDININEDEKVPRCFRTREYNKGNGICRQCGEYKKCDESIKKFGYAPDKDKPKKGRKKLIINSYDEDDYV